MTNVQRNLFIFTHVYFIIVVFQKTIIVGIVTLNSMEFIYVAILFLFLQYTWNEFNAHHFNCYIIRLKISKKFWNSFYF